MGETDPIKDARRRQEELFVKFEGAERIEVIGVVGANGPGAGKSRGEEQWTMSFELEMWRRVGAEIQRSKVRVVKRVSDEEWEKQKRCVAPDSVVRIRGRMVEYPWGRTTMHMLLDEVAGVERSDEEMNRSAVELKKRVTFEDRLFGTLVFDRRIQWYEGDVTWGGKAVKLYMHAMNQEKLEKVLPTAHRLWEEEVVWNERVMAYSVKKLLSLKNDNWLGEDEEEVTAKEFRKRMALEAIGIYEEEMFEFWFKDGDLFWGHSIQISGNLKEGPTQADIPG